MASGHFLFIYLFLIHASLACFHVICDDSSEANGSIMLGGNGWFMWFNTVFQSQLWLNLT